MGRIADIGMDLLMAAAAALPDPPARQIFTIGLPTEPLSDDQIAVGFIRDFRGVPGLEDPTQQFDYSQRAAEYVIRLTRCFPSSTQPEDTPSGAVIAAAEALANEADLLVPSLYAWRPPHGADSPQERWIGPVTGSRPSGFAHAVTITVQATL